MTCQLQVPLYLLTAWLNLFLILILLHVAESKAKADDWYVDGLTFYAKGVMGSAPTRGSRV